MLKRHPHSALTSPSTVTGAEPLTAPRRRSASQTRAASGGSRPALSSRRRSASTSAGAAAAIAVRRGIAPDRVAAAEIQKEVSEL